MGHVDVVVVGAGPVGLLLAIELTLAGLQVLVLERLAVPNPGIKALAVGPLGAEALQRRGMDRALSAEEDRKLAAMGPAGEDMRGRASKFRGHFAFLSIRNDSRDEPARRMRMVDQQGLERVLADRARAMGIEVRRACEVTGFMQHEHKVDVEWISPAGPDHVGCFYLVGCDGGRSPVRKMARFAFPGTPPTMTMYQAILDLENPECLPDGWQRTSSGVFAHGPFPRRLFMLDFSGPPQDREAPVTRDEVETALRRISGVDVRVAALEQANRWADNTRLVDSYRKGRVLLAGDAAHVHSPFGGQGLSLGLADAANLGWKLASVVRGGMTDSLLDSYTAERRPIAEAVLANTLAQVAIMRPDPQSGAMRDLMARLMQMVDVNRFVGDMMSGVEIRYDLGSDLAEVGRLVGDRSVGPDPAGPTLYDLMQEGTGLLLDATPDREASAIVKRTAGHVRWVAVESGPSILIRPDACVAWVDRDNCTAGLETALRRWFEPARLPASPSSSMGLQTCLTF